MGPLNLRRHPSAAPVADPAADARLEEGRQLFNRGEFWHAHEAWEPLWMGLEGQPKLTVQGLIMAAAMLHQYQRGVAQGVANHWANVLQRIGEAGPTYGIDIPDLRRQLRPLAEAAAAGDFTRRAAEVQMVRGIAQ